jgi:hypothetical protein
MYIKQKTPRTENPSQFFARNAIYQYHSIMRIIVNVVGEKMDHIISRILGLIYVLYIIVSWIIGRTLDIDDVILGLLIIMYWIYWGR